MEEEKNEKQIKEEFFDKNEKTEASTFSKVMNVVLWIVLFAWIGICLIDFYNTHQQKDPLFCVFGKESTTYEDGRVDSCTGLGYKIYNYKRTCFTGVEYGPFWSKDSSVETDTCKSK